MTRNCARSLPRLVFYSFWLIAYTAFAHQKLYIEHKTSVPQIRSIDFIDFHEDDHPVFEPIDINLPKTLYAVAGLRTSIYFNNITSNNHNKNYHYEVICNVGITQKKRWTIIPSNQEIGSHPLTIELRDQYGRLLQTQDAVLIVSQRHVASHHSLRLLIVGDSLTYADQYPSKIADLLNREPYLEWKMLGTIHNKEANMGVFYEAYPGWTWNAFLTFWDLNSNLVKHSPFLYANENGYPVLDLSRYFSEQDDHEPPDVVFFLLGINDCFYINPDKVEKMRDSIQETLNTAEKLLMAFHDAAPNAILAVGITPPSNDQESSFEKKYEGKYHLDGWKKIQYELAKQMLDKFSNLEHKGIYLVPINVNIDTTKGYPINDAVHPNHYGYSQIAKSFYAWLRYVYP